ncbi:metalloprotease TldD [Sinimarinibacterium thermocellulolyticum]|uniref:Metalloprotease TldD n=1 Tax=Sinimarinibacterium thermocellulolyticum TaxID=3170016 RepID=A0ABV2A6I5_9GAMM
MTDTLDIARKTLLDPAQLDGVAIERVLDRLMKPGVDAADLYFQQSMTETWTLEDGIVKSGANHAERGVGVRACAGEKQGLAYSDALELPALIDAAQAAGAIVRHGQQGCVRAATSKTVRALYPALDPVQTLAVPTKLELLRRADRAARAADARVVQVTVSLAARAETVLIAASDGTRSADVRPLVRMDVSVIVEHQGRREQGHAGAGGRGAYLDFLGGERPEQLAREAVRMALVQLDAVPAPAGTLTVVLGPGWPGVLLHEAVGHGLEGDFNRRGSSAFSGRIGQTVASPLCTVVDDGTLPGRRGSLTVDDEGTPSQCTTLIENGVLRGYMQDKLNARLMKTAPTGNGRRESYAALPMPRMTNTYMLPGAHDPQEIIASVDKGIYAANFGGGQVDITSGNFVFSASEAYLIENGRITRPVKGATLIGNGPEVLTRVSMVGNDLKLDAGIGVCGKDGQSVPVGVGQPTLRIDGLTVGGTSG